MKALCLLFVFASLALPACSGSSLRDDQELDNMPNREATKPEGKRLKLCLRAVAHEQNKMYEKTGRYYERTQDMHVQKYCKDLKLRMETGDSTYEATAILHDDDYAVRWTINQNNVMEEELEPEVEDVDF